MKDLDSIGNKIELKALESLALQDKNLAWVVTSGSVQLFLARLDNGLPYGFRIPIGSLEKNDILFGTDSFSSQDDWAIIAIPTKEASVLACPLEKLISQAKKQGDLETLAEKVDTWVGLLTLKLSSFIKDDRLIQHIDLSETPQTLSAPFKARQETLWVQLQSGTACLFALDDSPIETATGNVAIDQNCWLNPETSTEIVTLSTKDLLISDDLKSALQATTQRLSAATLSCYQSTQKKALSEKLSHNQQIIEDAFLSLQNILGISSEVATETPHYSDLQKAIYVIAKKQKAPFKVGAQRIDHQPEDDRKLVGAKIGLIARGAKLRVREVALKGSWWKCDSGPLLTFIDETNKPVALLPDGRGGYEMFDPEDNSLKPVNEKLANKTQFFAFQFYRSFDNIKLKFKPLLRFSLAGLLPDITTVIVTGCIVGLLGLVTPIITGTLFDTVIPSGNRSELFQLVMGLLAVTFASTAFTMTRNFALIRIEGKADTNLQASVWDRLLKLPVPFFRKYPTADLAARANAVSVIRKTLSGTALNTLLSGLFTIFSFILLFYYSFKLAMVVVGLSIIFAGATFFIGYWKTRYEKHLDAAQRKTDSSVLQIVNGIPKLRASGSESRAFSMWATLFTRERQWVFKAENVANILESINAMFPVLAMALIFLSVVYMLKTGGLTTGQFIAFNAAYGNFMSGALEISNTILTIVNIAPLFESAKPILESLPEVDEVKTDPSELSGHIELSEVCFQYDIDGPEIIKNLSLNIGSGEYVAIVGGSGCGKSTLIRLLLGFERPQSGAVFMDDKNLENLDITLVRNQFGVVLQNSQILSGDIFTNIIGASTLTIDDAWEAAELAGFADDIRAMPMGMHTYLGAFGGGLSGGQLQRLTICRAIVHKPKILIFDEATSALDNVTQTKISQCLSDLKATRIVVAHRLSTIIDADRIIVMDAGRIVQIGNYDELMAQEGLFRELAKRQIA